MNKEEIQRWCDENNYALVEKRKNPLTFEEVAEVAEKVIGIDDGTITEKHRKSELSFSRFLAVTYLYNYYAPRLISKAFNFHHSIVSYAINQRLFDESGFKFLKPWQQEATKEFIYQIRLAGGEVSQPEIRTQGMNF